MRDIDQQVDLAQRMREAADILEEISVRYAYPHTDFPTPDCVEWSAHELRREANHLVGPYEENLRKARFVYENGDLFNPVKRCWARDVLAEAGEIQDY